MSNVDARIALAELITERIKKLRIDRRDFMRATGFTHESSFTCYLRGYSNLPEWQVPYVAQILQFDERLILLMCLAQARDDWVMALFRRHIHLNEHN